LLLLSGAALAINEPVDLAKTLAMRTATNQLTAYNALSDSDYVYDWNSILTSPSSPSSSSSSSSNDSSASSSCPGSVFFADATTWPILAAGTISASQINLDACAMLSPHSHRATKLAIAVNGTTRTWMRLANGATDRVTTLTPGMMTIFPPGAMHTMSNQGCTPARLYTFFDSADPGTLSFAQAFMATGPDIALAVMPFIHNVQSSSSSTNDTVVDAATAGADDDDADSSSWNATSNLVPPIGLGAQVGTHECLKRCGLA
ncbi:hypothetical protein DV736_g5914, partial [Chaetothyriales sp. CBS 134916]